MKTGLAFLLLVALSPAVQAAELNWLTNYSDALTLARTTSRPMLLVIGPDERLPGSGEQVGSGPAAQPSHDLFDAYVLCKIDASSGYGKRLAEAYRVTELPHSVIIDKTATRVLYSKAGQVTDDDWKPALIKYQAAARVQQVPKTQSPRTFWSPAWATGRTYNFRKPPVCNT